MPEVIHDPAAKTFGLCPSAPGGVNVVPTFVIPIGVISRRQISFLDADAEYSQRTMKAGSNKNAGSGLHYTAIG